MKRTASAVWHGDLKKGKGTLSAPGGVLDETPYSFSTRFEDAPGTNPEELIAAAHAGCFTMAFSAFLGAANYTPDTLSTKAALTLEQVNGDWTITTIDLDADGQGPGDNRGEIPGDRRGGEGEMPGLPRAEREDHAPGDPGIVTAGSR